MDKIITSLKYAALFPKQSIVSIEMPARDWEQIVLALQARPKKRKFPSLPLVCVTALLGCMVLILTGHRGDLLPFGALCGVTLFLVH